MINKIELSKFNLGVTLGFLYWLNESHTLRGLKNVSIEDYPTKLKELRIVYDCKYPNGLTGWNDDSSA